MTAGRSGGVRRSNAAAAAQIEGAEGARADLLFDPQTAGGLLAAVPETAAAEVIRALREAGYPAARIGVVRDGVPGVRLV